MMISNKRLWSKALGVLSLVSLAVVIACTGSNAKDKPRYKTKDAPGPGGAVMTIDNKGVSLEDLVGDDRLEYIDLVTKVYDFERNKAGDALLNVVYGDAAKKENMPVGQYIETKVLKGEPKVSDSEYNKFVQEKKIPAEQLKQNPQLKDRILAYMKAQKKQEEREKLIVKLSKEHDVVLYFKKPDMKVEIELGQSPSFGKKDSKVKIVEFSDFQCPFCSRAANTVTELKKAYGNKVVFAFKHFPLPMHPQARPASEASMCVNAQGTDKFWKYHDKLFANQDKLDEENLKKFAKEVGANVDEFTKCFAEKRFAKAVQDDLDYGTKMGVRSTPTFFVNGKLISGAQPIEAFREIIDEEMSN